MFRTAESLIRQVQSAVTQARIAMNSAKLSTTNPPFHTVIATPERTLRSPSNTSPHAASDPTRPMQAIQRWMSGRSPGLSTAMSTERRAIPTSIASGSSASVMACAKSDGILASGDPRGDLEDAVGDHGHDSSRPDSEENRRGDQRNQHR